MSTPVVTNIIVGGATVWYAPYGEATPDETTVEYGDVWGGNWDRVGFTKAPLTMAYETSEMEVEVEEETGPLDRLRTSEKATLETVLAELSPEYIALASGQDPTTAVTTTAAGAAQRGFSEVGMGTGSALQKFAWGFEGRYQDSAGAFFPVRVFIWKATTEMGGALEFSNKSGNYPGIPLKVKALADPTQAAGEKLFKFQLITAEITA